MTAVRRGQVWRAGLDLTKVFVAVWHYRVRNPVFALVWRRTRLLGFVRRAVLLDRAARVRARASSGPRREA